MNTARIVKFNDHYRIETTATCNGSPQWIHNASFMGTPLEFPTEKAAAKFLENLKN